MQIFEKINNLEILSVLDAFGINYKRDSWSQHTYSIVNPDWKIDTSFKVNTAKNIWVNFWWWGEKGWPFDLIARLILGVDPQTDEGRKATIDYFVASWLVKNEEWQKDFIPSLTLKQLLEQFEELKIGWYSSVISSFLLTRGFNYDWIQKNQIKVWEVFADIGYYDSYFTTEKQTWQDEEGKWHNEKWDDPKTVWILLFPCFNESKELIGVKLRRKDWKTIRGKKSLAVGKTGLLYDDISLDRMIIVEWETDYLVLKLLGYNNLIANLGWVQSWRNMLKSVLSDSSTILCLYDNDTAWYNWKIALQETFKRTIEEVVFPIRKSQKGRLLSDINDYYEVWYDTKKKWDDILSNSRNVWESETKKDRTDFVFLRSNLEYYDTNFKKIQQTWPVAAYLGQTAKELAKMVKDNIIKSYDDLCYHEWGKKDHFNTMDETVIIKHWGDAEAKLHPCIKTIVDNLWHHNQWNISWLHKSILYKLTHINTAYIPALILYWEWDSGKGTFIELIKKILWEDNCQTWLGQRDLEWTFDSFQWDKLLVEYKEISSWNKRDDKKILDRIKSLINEKNISINLKFQNSRQIENKARFHFSSNHSLPIQLDSKHSWNKRFTIIKTGSRLPKPIFEEFYWEVIINERIIREYVAWLYEEFPDIPDSKTLLPLENKDKRDLENACEWVANLFFEWLENKYPYICKISIKEKNKLLMMYCEDNWEEYTDIRYKQSNFDLWISHRYEKKNSLRIDWKIARGYQILKTPFELEKFPLDAKTEFKEWEVDRFIIE